MRTYKKTALVALIIIITVLLLTLAANLIIQSAAVQEQFRKKAEDIIGMPVTMGRVSFNPFTGLHIPSVAINDSAHHRSVEAISIDFMPDWYPLLHHYWGKPLHAIEVWQGALHIKTVTLNHGFVFHRIKATLKKAPASFTVDPFKVEVAQGEVTGSFLLQQDQRKSPYQLTTHFSGISLSKLTSTEGVNAIEGALQGTFFMKGILENPEKKEGAGTLEVVGMQFQSGGFLAQIGQILQIQELQMLKLHKATASYAIDPHQLVVKSLQLLSDNLMIRAHGTVSYEGSLGLSALLLINTKLQSRLQGLIPVSLLVPSQEPGFVAIPFNVNGTLQNPQSNLLERVPLPAVNSNVQGLIKQILNF